MYSGTAAAKSGSRSNLGPYAHISASTPVLCAFFQKMAHLRNMNNLCTPTWNGGMYKPQGTAVWKRAIFRQLKSAFGTVIPYQKHHRRVSLDVSRKTRLHCLRILDARNKRPNNFGRRSDSCLGCERTWQLYFGARWLTDPKDCRCLRPFTNFRAVRYLEASPAKDLQLKGKVEKILFSSPDNDFRVLLVDIFDLLDAEGNGPFQKTGNPSIDIEEVLEMATIRVPGILPAIRQGDKAIFRGTLVRHQKYGIQLHAQEYELVRDTDEQSIIRALTCLKGISFPICFSSWHCFITPSTHSNVFFHVEALQESL